MTIGNELTPENMVKVMSGSEIQEAIGMYITTILKHKEEKERVRQRLIQ